MLFVQFGFENTKYLAHIQNKEIKVILYVKDTDFYKNKIILKVSLK
jgi:hypothetical protein